MLTVSISMLLVIDVEGPMNLQDTVFTYVYLSGLTHGPSLCLFFHLLAMSRTNYSSQWLPLVAMYRTKSPDQWLPFVAMYRTKYPDQWLPLWLCLEINIKVSGSILWLCLELNLQVGL